MEYHIPVLYKEVLENIIKDKYRVYVDCTLGGGGHSQMILEKIPSTSILIGLDQDEEAISFASNRLKDFKNLLIVKDNFKNLDKVLFKNSIDKVDAILMDIGVSSKQLDDPSRGFSYKHEARLDMRMDKSIKTSAYEVVNSYSEEALANIIFKYGEEPFSRKIAKKIVEKRKEKKIETTTELSKIVIEAIGKSMKKHPAKRTFQALRIYVNKELEVLEEALNKAVNLLNDGGRLLVITFHSLEDRIVKEMFNNFENPCRNDDLPVFVECSKKSLGVHLTKKVIKATSEEINENNRSHSAKLRIFERVENG